jgi:hypothetical protein
VTLRGGDTTVVNVTLFPVAPTTVGVDFRKPVVQLSAGEGAWTTYLRFADNTVTPVGAMHPDLSDFGAMIALGNAGNSVYAIRTSGPSPIKGI